MTALKVLPGRYHDLRLHDQGSRQFVVKSLVTFPKQECDVDQQNDEYNKGSKVPVETMAELMAGRALSNSGKYHKR